MLNYLYCKHTLYSHNEAASNLSDFFFRFHFQGLKSLPSAENLLFLSKGGVLAPEPKLFVRKAAPFCFFATTKRVYVNIKCTFLYTTEILDSRMNHRNRTNWIFHIMPFSHLAKILIKKFFYIIYHFYIKNNIKNNNYFHKVMILKIINSVQQVYVRECIFK